MDWTRICHACMHACTCGLAFDRGRCPLRLRNGSCPRRRAEHSRLIRHVTRATHTPPGWDRPACGRVVVGAHQRSTTPSSATNSELPVLMQTERLRGSSGRRARTHGSAGGNSFPRQDRRGLLEPKLCGAGAAINHAPALLSSTNNFTPSIASCQVHSRPFCSIASCTSADRSCQCHPGEHYYCIRTAVDRNTATTGANRTGRPLCDVTCKSTVRPANATSLTVHGFTATFFFELSSRDKAKADATKVKRPCNMGTPPGLPRPA